MTALIIAFAVGSLIGGSLAGLVVYVYVLNEFRSKAGL